MVMLNPDFAQGVGRPDDPRVVGAIELRQNSMLPPLAEVQAFPDVAGERVVHGADRHSRSQILRFRVRLQLGRVKLAFLKSGKSF